MQGPPVPRARWRRQPLLQLRQGPGSCPHPPRALRVPPSTTKVTPIPAPQSLLQRSLLARPPHPSPWTHYSRPSCRDTACRRPPSSLWQL